VPAGPVGGSTRRRPLGPSRGASTTPRAVPDEPDLAAAIDPACHRGILPCRELERKRTDGRDRLVLAR
jgi:hypothetical protein